MVSRQRAAICEGPPVPARLGGPDVPMQTRRWDVCHACVCLALHTVTNWTSVCWGKNRGQTDSHMYTEGRATNVLCVTRGWRSTSSQTCRKISADVRGTRLVSLEAVLNVRAAMEAADLTSLPYTQDGDGGRFWIWDRHSDMGLWRVWLHLLVHGMFSLLQLSLTSPVSLFVKWCSYMESESQLIICLSMMGGPTVITAS